MGNLSLSEFNELLGKWEPLWLLILLTTECLISVIGTAFLIVEYYWGRPDITLKNEARQRRRLRKQEPMKVEKEFL